jgi:HEAT repeat protein
MDGGGPSSTRRIQDPEGLLRSALEKIVFFECRVSQLESELAAAKAASERARGDASGSRRREVELEQALSAEKGQRGEAGRRAAEAEERVRLLEAERERLLGGLVDRARLEGASPGGGASDDGQADLAGFIAELRAEIETLRAFRDQAMAAGFGGAATAPERKPAERAATVAELGGRFETEGRVGVSAGDRARLAELLGTRADRALYERSMDDLAAADPGKRLRAVRALEALGSRAAAPLVAAALSREPEAEVKVALLGALARFREPFAADLAERELADPRPPVRAAALEALSAAGESRAMERLSGALCDESPVVRRRAALLLGFTTGEAAVEALAIALGDADRGVARAAAAALSGRPSASAQAALARGLEHPDVSVRRAAAAALGRVAGEAVEPDGTVSARRASSRRIAEKLASMDGEELRAAVLRSAETARVTAERVMAATTAKAAITSTALAAVSLPPPASHVSSPVRPEPAEGRAAVAPTPRTAVAVVDAPAAPGPADLGPRILTELRAALRGATGDGLARVLSAPQPEVEAALAALSSRGQVERRGTRWFVT